MGIIRESWIDAKRIVASSDSPFSDVLRDDLPIARFKFLRVTVRCFREQLEILPARGPAPEDRRQ